MAPVRTRVALALALGTLLVPASSARAAERATCGDLTVLASPAEPRAGRPLRVVVASDAGSPDDVVIEEPSGRGDDGARATLPGPPWSVVTTFDRPEPGTYRVGLHHDGGTDACRDVFVDASSGRSSHGHRPAAPRAWDRKSEALYAAWIEHLFAAPPGADVSFPSLEPVLRDPTRNVLYDHFGLGEDGPGPRALPATPDCADLPYVLRAYFAWKLGLPFGFRRCDRGSRTAPPRCGGVSTNQEPRGADPLAAFLGFSRALVDTVHSGNARTALDDDATDFYPVPLTREAVRPGTIYADPYGHTLVVTGWVPQTSGRSGLLYAVDAQPDHTVARKRFWEGNFLFVGVPSAGPGFKAFRPLVRDAGGRLRPLDNADLEDDPRFLPWSNEQEGLDPEAFYARMSALVNPQGEEPERAYEDALAALVEQLETRVRSVDNGARYVRAHPGDVIAMPEGAAIFQTSGPWEDYSTPSRDFRLIIAFDVLDGLPRRIRRHPELFVLGGRTPGAAAADVERLHARRVAERAIEYTRSDDTPWRLTVAEVLARRTAFEMAYNPNDCVEIRWGAPPDGPEASTCRRHAPAEQRARMEGYRIWFRESRRPAA
jgi:hypothetical protein